MSKQFIELGPVPCDEDAVQVSENEDYFPAMYAECQRYKELLERLFPHRPGRVHFGIRTFPHDFGQYCEVVIYFDSASKTEMNFAFNVENNTPSNWVKTEELMDFTATRNFRVVDDNGGDPTAADAKLPLWVICDYRRQPMDGPFSDVAAGESAAQKLMTIPYPLHNDDMKQMPEGLYLTTYHGRTTEDQVLEDWGYDGPVIGPLKFCHTTYGHHIKLAFVNEEDFEKYAHLFKEGSNYDFADLHVTRKDLLHCGEKYYGDWSVFYNKPEA